MANAGYALYAIIDFTREESDSEFSPPNGFGGDQSARKTDSVFIVVVQYVSFENNRQSLSSNIFCFLVGPY